MSILNTLINFVSILITVYNTLDVLIFNKVRLRDGRATPAEIERKSLYEMIVSLAIILVVNTYFVITADMSHYLFAGEVFLVFIMFMNYITCIAREKHSTVVIEDTVRNTINIVRMENIKLCKKYSDVLPAELVNDVLNYNGGINFNYAGYREDFCKEIVKPYYEKLLIRETFNTDEEIESFETNALLKELIRFYANIREFVNEHEHEYIR